MHFKNALNAFIYTVFRAFFTQSLAKFRILHNMTKFNSNFINNQLSATFQKAQDFTLLSPSRP